MQVFGACLLNIFPDCKHWSAAHA